MLHPTDPFYQTFEELVYTISKQPLVIDVGTSSRFAKDLAPFRSLFKENYFALGYEPDPGYGDDACDINGDILTLPFTDASIPAIICLEVLEHVFDPRKAVDEIYRVLKPGGYLLLSVPFLLPYHGKSSQIGDYRHESYPDYWRFTYQGLELLAQKFKKVDIYPVTNGILYYMSSFPLLQKIPLLKTALFKKMLEKIQPKRISNPTHRLCMFARK